MAFLVVKRFHVMMSSRLSCPTWCLNKDIYNTWHNVCTRFSFALFIFACANTLWWVCVTHDDVIKWKHFSRYWPFVRGIHRSTVNSPHKGQWRGASIFSLICAWTNGRVNNRGAGDLRCHRAHYDVAALKTVFSPVLQLWYGRILT